MVIHLTELEKRCILGVSVKPNRLDKNSSLTKINLTKLKALYTQEQSHTIVRGAYRVILVTINNYENSI